MKLTDQISGTTARFIECSVVWGASPGLKIKPLNILIRGTGQISWIISRYCCLTLSLIISYVDEMDKSMFSFLRPSFYFLCFWTDSVLCGFLCCGVYMYSSSTQVSNGRPRHLVALRRLAGPLLDPMSTKQETQVGRRKFSSQHDYLFLQVPFLSSHYLDLPGSIPLFSYWTFQALVMVLNQRLTTL